MNNDIVSKLQPFSYLRADFQTHVKSKTKVVNRKQGDVIFKRGEDVESYYYLLKGSVEIENSKGVKATKSPSAMCFSQGTNTYKHTATAAGDVVALKVQLDQNELNALLCWEFALRFMDNPEWGYSLFECEMFEHLAPGKILRFMQSFEKINVTADELLIKEHQFESHFYVMCEGIANVFQGDIVEDSEPVSQITPFQTFGEAALIDDLPRNASIQMSSQGSLMKFNTANLNKFTSDNISASIFLDKAALKDFLPKANHHVIDIRSAQEAKLGTMKGALALPIDNPLELLSKIEQEHTYAIYSPYPELNKLVYNLVSLKNKNIYIFNPS